MMVSMTMQKAEFVEEQKLWNLGYDYVAGIDEVGRGAFAGPVVAAAIIFPKHCVFTEKLLYEINDSKCLSAKKREQLAPLIKKAASCFSIAEVSLSVINAVGIGKATQQAFREAIAALTVTPQFHLVDAFYIEKIENSLQKPIIHGDKISISIAAASIIAKVHRDQLMEKLHIQYPQYNFAGNKGYGTKMHRDSLSRFGLSPLHRTSFSLEKFLTKTKVPEVVT
jgi:ribonuclease HII